MNDHFELKGQSPYRAIDGIKSAVSSATDSAADALKVAGQTVQGAASTASDSLADLPAKTVIAYQASQEASADLLNRLVSRIHQNPLTAIIVAAGAGYLFARSRER